MFVPTALARFTLPRIADHSILRSARRKSARKRPHVACSRPNAILVVWLVAVAEDVISSGMARSHQFGAARISSDWVELRCHLVPASNLKRQFNHGDIQGP